MVSAHASASAHGWQNIVNGMSINDRSKAYGLVRNCLKSKYYHMYILNNLIIYHPRDINARDDTNSAKLFPRALNLDRKQIQFDTYEIRNG